MHTVRAHACTPTRVAEVDVRETTAIRSFTRAADVGMWQCTPSSNQSAGRTKKSCPKTLEHSTRVWFAFHPLRRTNCWDEAPLRHRHRGLLAPANHACNEVHLAVTVTTVISFVRTVASTSCLLKLCVK